MASDKRITAEQQQKIQEKKLRKLRRKKVNIDTVHVKKSKGKHINSSLGGDIAIFILL